MFKAGQLVSQASVPSFWCEEKFVPHEDFVRIVWDSTSASGSAFPPESAATHSEAGNSPKEQQEARMARPHKASFLQ